MSIHLTAQAPEDGTVQLDWESTSGSTPQQTWLLCVRTGARPGFTSVVLDGSVHRWKLTNLGRHQRYRFLVMGRARGELEYSSWLNVTPQKDLPSTPEDLPGPHAHLAHVTRLLVMPQDRRLTAYWQLSPGFAQKVELAILEENRVLQRWELEPEVRGFTVDATRFPALKNGRAYVLTARTLLAGVEGEPHSVAVSPAPQGQERDANARHPQGNLVYACLSLTSELDVFEDGAPPQAGQVLTCGHCGGATQWQEYRLRCTSCRAEFIGNGRGDFLDVTRLRFGTCRCCLPQKLLIQDVGSPVLRCAHSGKEHIQTPGQKGHLLVEELPFGLCQCCRPRRPLQKGSGQNVECSQSKELHRRADGDAGTFVLLPSAPVFDAAAIDELLDAGLADICAAGVSKGRR